MPWHGYFSLKFNQDHLNTNPARDFFDCTMIVSREVELGQIGNQGPPDPVYDAIEGVVTGQDHLTSSEHAAILRDLGIKYVVYAQDVRESDVQKYDFLNQITHPLYTWDGLTLYLRNN